MLQKSDSSVDIATGYGLDGQGSVLGRDKFLLFSTALIPNLRPTQPAIQWEPGTLSLGINWPGRGADHSLLTSAEVKNSGAIPPLTPMSSWNNVELNNHTEILPSLLTIYFRSAI
jgi:hypothetical protein